VRSDEQNPLVQRVMGFQFTTLPLNIFVLHDPPQFCEPIIVPDSDKEQLSVSSIVCNEVIMYIIMFNSQLSVCSLFTKNVCYSLAKCIT
jgi:hypothetical protein